MKPASADNLVTGSKKTGTHLRVCILTETYYPVVGGGETQTRSLVRGLIANDLDVFVLTRQSDPNFEKIEQIDGTVVYRLPPVGSQHLKKWGLLPTSLLNLVRLRQHYDLIFVSGFRVIGVGAVIAARLLGKKCILKADSSGEMSGKFFTDGLSKFKLNLDSRPFRLLLQIRNSILRRSDGFVAISSEIAGELVGCGVAPAKAIQIPNSVDTELFHPVSEDAKVALRHKLDLPLDRTIITYTGRLVSYKGLPLLLRVWRQLSKQYDDVLLLLVGEGGLDIHNCENELRGYVDAHGLQDSVEFTGAVQDVHVYLQASDIFVFPTESEAFGISLIEAMACGLPVVASKVGGIKDILVDEQYGTVIEPGNFNQILSALIQLVSLPEKRGELGNAARRTVTARYRSDVIAVEYTRLFKNIALQTE